MTIQINLISEQLLPNVIPTLSQGVKSIEKIYLVLAGQRFQERAALLQNFYKDKGVKEVEIFSCQDPNDYYALRSKAKALYKDIKAFYPEAYIALNATGGTKPMSLAFTQEFDNLPERSMVLYTDTSNKKVIILNDADNLPDLPYEPVLSINDYLHLYDFEVDDSINSNSVSHDEVEQRKELSVKCLALANSDRKCIAQMNAMAQQTNFATSKKPFTPDVILTQPLNQSLQTIFEFAAYHGLVKLSKHAIHFNDENSARYIGGGWLEELIYMVAIEAEVEAVELSVTGHQRNKHDNKIQHNVKNELDVVLVNNNQMLIIEAKTLDWSRSGKGQEATLKLDSLRNNYGGSFANGMLVSVFPFPDSIKARVNNINNLTPLHLTTYESLLSALKAWKKNTI